MEGVNGGLLELPHIIVQPPGTHGFAIIDPFLCLHSDAAPHMLAKETGIGFPLATPACIHVAAVLGLLELALMYLHTPHSHTTSSGL